MYIRESLTQLFQVLTDASLFTGPKRTYHEFWNHEGENVCFLASRVKALWPRCSDEFQQIMEFSQNQPWFLAEEPQNILALREMHKEVRPVITSYPDYAKNVKSANWDLATRAFMAQGLAYWSVENKQPAHITQEASKRLDDVHLALKWRGAHVKSESTSEIYFVTHLVLLDTWYGAKSPTAELPTKEIIRILTRWCRVVYPKWKANEEIFIEVLLCLSILGQQHIIETWFLAMKPSFGRLAATKSTLGLHYLYHVWALWALLFAAQAQFRRIALWCPEIPKEIPKQWLQEARSLGILLWFQASEKDVVAKLHHAPNVCLVHSVRKTDVPVVSPTQVYLCSILVNYIREPMSLTRLGYLEYVEHDILEGKLASWNLFA